MALDILHDNWGPYTHTEVENALKAYLSVLENRINQAIQSGGVGLTDLSAEVQALLNKANTALQPENIAAWARAQNKPGYTVSEITGVEGFQNLLAKLQDMDQKIQAAAQSGEIPDDEMSSTSEKPVQNKVIKAYVDGLIQGLQNVLNTITQDGATQGVIDTFNEVKAFLDGISSSDTLAAKLATLVPQTRTVNGKALSSNVTIGMSDIQGLVDAINNAGSGAVSVTTNQDGTFTIHVGETDYTINLNHTHENMAKLVVCEESDLPSTLDPATIYAITDSGETEIEKLIIRGMEFAGGGVPAGTPAITKPSGTSINLGENDGSGVSKAIEIKANSHITGDLTVALAANSDLSFDTTNLPSGVTYNSGAGTLTIAQATAMQGVNITIVYSGSGAAEIDGGLVISGGGATPKSVVVVVALPQPIGVKLTGTQWLQTDYYPNANTEFELVCKFTDKGNTSMNNGYFLTCANNSDTTEKFQIAFSQNKYKLWHTVKTANAQCLDFSASADQANFVLDNSVLSFVKGTSKGTFKFVPGGDESKAKSIQTPLMDYTMQNPLRIGRGNTYFFALFELTIYELTITENGTEVRHYVPKIENGVPGLYDTKNGVFISSETAKTSGLATDELEAVYAQNN